MNLRQIKFTDYYAEAHSKNQVYLHHTAGAAEGERTFSIWQSDPVKVATCVAISRDGEIVQGYSSKHWAYHLGLKNKFFAEFGLPYKGLDKNLEAITVLQRAISHNPRDATSLSLLGELYCLEKQGNEIALSLCHQAVELDDTRWDHWYRLGLVRFQCGDIGEARAAFKESITRNPRGIAAKYLLGQVYQHLGETKKAAREYNKVLKQVPSHLGCA